MDEARAAAHELMHVGRQLNDPRSIGLGLGMLAGIANSIESYAEALEYSEQLLSIVITPWDSEAATLAKGFALVMLGPIEEGEKLLEGQRSRRLLGKAEEGAKLIEAQRSRALIYGYLHTLSITDPFVGICKILQGDIGAGIYFIEEAILQREKEGYRRVAHSYRITLCEIYLSIIGGYGYLPLSTLLRNLPSVLKVMATASSRIRSLAALFLEDPETLPSGYYVWPSENDSRPALQDQEKACPRP